MSTPTRAPSTSQGNYKGNSLYETSSGGHGRTSDHGLLAYFFAQYPRFKYNSTRSATDEFYRLCNLNANWDEDEKRVAKEGFQDALTMQFNNIYGTNENDLTNWQILCAKLEIDPIPESLNACRQAVRNTHVNLVDLVDLQRKVRIFPTVVALSRYTIETGKFFPRDNANAGNLLKFLLRHILNLNLPRKKGGGARGRGRGRGGHRGRGA